MPAENSYYPYLGSGKMYARIAGTVTPFMELGNASKVDISVKDDKKSLKDFTKPGGGTYASVTRIDNAIIQMKLHDLNKTNVARAVFGTSADVTGAAVVGEVLIGYKGGLTMIAHPNPTAVVLTNVGATVTYAQGVDYEVRPGGIFVFDAGAITEGQSLRVNYTFASYSKVEALSTGAITLELHFEGLNEANSGKPVILDAYRCLLSPAKALSLLGENFSDLDVEAEILKDTTRVGAGVSQYFCAKLC